MLFLRGYVVCLCCCVYHCCVYVKWFRLDQIRKVVWNCGSEKTLPKQSFEFDRCAQKTYLASNNFLR